MAETPEGKLKKSFCGKLRRMGCTVLQYKQDSTTVKGFPDTIVLLPDSDTIFIEFKRAKNAKFQPGQKEWNKKLTDRSFFAYIVYPGNADEVMAEIKYLCSGR